MSVHPLPVIALLAGLLPAAAASAPPLAERQSVTVLMAHGPGAAADAALSAGLADYLDLLDRRDGGINGVRLGRDECELAADASRAAACLDPVRRRGVAIVLPPPGAAPALLADSSRTRRITLLTSDDAGAAGVDGRVFPYAFALLAGPLSQAAAQLRFIADSEGGTARLRGKRIVYLHADRASQREVGELLELLAAQHGFRVSRHRAGEAAGEQAALWQSISREGADWVLLATAGAATTVALRAAAGAGFAAERIIGSVAAGAERDVAAAGAAAVGYIAASTSPVGLHHAVVNEIRRHVSASPATALARDRGSADYLRGVALGLLVGEAIRLAQQRFGARALDAEQLRWGLQRLRLDEARLARLGALELLPPISTSCTDHEGSGAVKFQQWLGSRWNVVSDWISGDPAAVARVVDASARRHLDAAGQPPAVCDGD